MGAVVDKGEQPMLILEYCVHGSLYDILHNETMIIEGDLVHNILQDIAQGVRFLHAPKPPVIHGDLKSANVLIGKVLCRSASSTFVKVAPPLR